MRDSRLAAFDEMNRKAAGKPKVPWKTRMNVIAEQFPSVQKLQWQAALRDDDVMARVIRDILKADQAEPGRSGPRRPLDYQQGMATWRQITGQDYANEPFASAFRALAGVRSVRHMASKTGLSRSQVDRLLRGEAEPDVGDMAIIARAFKKDPSYFLEYRIASVAAVIIERLESSPESSIHFYRSLMEEAA